MARIFVVDDDEQLLRMVGLMLERGGHTPTLISNPIQGLESIKADPPDLVILDVMMPGMSGHDVCRQLRIHESTETLPVLILTARAQETDRETALESGADEYLSKPVTSQELLRNVNDLLNRPPRHQAPINRPTLSPMLIAVFGLSGGVGRTTLAVNLAIALRQISRTDVCLLDLSVSGGQASMHLRLQPRAGWADMKRREEPDSWSTIADLMVDHHTGLKLLSAPTMPLAPTEPDGATTHRLLAHLRENMVFTIVDLPPVLSEAAKTTVRQADMGLHVLTPDITAVQTAVRTDRLLSNLGITPQQRSHILNQRTSETGLPKQTIERGLNARIPFHLPYDAQQVQSLTQGSPLALRGNQPGYGSVIWRMGEALWQKVQSGA
ncbi:MAG: response regulator [Anaerolineales bacterium]|nr:response regulator [Anaerolineales bacterium]